MAIIRTTNTNLSKVDRLLYLVNCDFFFGIGKNTAWDTSWGNDVTEDNPPTPESSVVSLPDIKLYKKPYFQTLATESQCGDIQFDSCGESIGKKLTLINLETTNRETLDAIAPDYLYFRIDIEEADLDFASIENFRLAGLYKDITFDTTGQIRYLPSSLEQQGTLYWAAYFTLIEKITLVNKASTFQVIIKA